MIVADRREEILQLLYQHQRMRVAELSEILGVSEVTVRRYLTQLADQGKVRRYHGWVALASEAAAERPFRERAQQATEEKERIARYAASMIPDGATIMLSGGTTTARIIHHLRDRKGLTIITSALNIAAEVVEWESCRLIVCGGLVRDGSYQIIGPVAVDTIRQLTADFSFIGVDGITTRHGLMTSDIFEAEVDAAMIRASRRAVVVADSRKLGRTSIAVISPVTEIETLITDQNASPHICRDLEDHGVEVIRV
ncbi:MAG: DeoR/GlpR transcriptional regulator [Bacillota bacterium]|nr:MAG: DeoR/GlpR transcriptional regulator [Bacillota bacterium]